MAVLAAHRDHRGSPAWFAGDARNGGGRLVLWVSLGREGEEEKQRRGGASLGSCERGRKKKPRA